MVLLPVIGPGGEPLLIDGGGNLVPALAEDPCDCCAPPCPDCIDDITAVSLTLNGYEDGEFCQDHFVGGSAYTVCTFSNMNGTYTLTRVGTTTTYKISGLHIVIGSYTGYSSNDCSGDSTCTATSWITDISATVECSGDNILISGISIGGSNDFSGNCTSTTSGDDLEVPNFSESFPTCCVSFEAAPEELNICGTADTATVVASVEVLC